MILEMSPMFVYLFDSFVFVLFFVFDSLFLNLLYFYFQKGSGHSLESLKYCPMTACKLELFK